MIQALEESFPSEIAMKILKFCSHPTAQMIKDSYREFNLYDEPLFGSDSEDERDENGKAVLIIREFKINRRKKMFFNKTCNRKAVLMTKEFKISHRNASVF